MTFIAVLSSNGDLVKNLQQTLRKDNFLMLHVQSIDDLVRYASSQPVHFILYDDRVNISITKLQNRINQVNSIDIPIIVLTNVISKMGDFYKMGVLNVLDISVNFETLRLILTTYTKHMDIRLRYKVQSLTLGEATSAGQVMDVDSDNTITQIPSIIRKHIFSTPITIEFLASELSISRRHLLRKIYDTYNKTAINLINDVKMSICHELLLQGDHTIDEVSELLGFKSQYYFKKKYDNYLKVLASKPITKEEEKLSKQS